MMYRDHDGVGAIAGVLFLLLFGGALAALVAGLLLLFRRGARSGPPPVGPAVPMAGWGPEPGYPPVPPTLAAEQTLADRLARGEIEVPEYEQRLAALRRSRPVPPVAPPPSCAVFGSPPPAAPGSASAPPVAPPSAPGPASAPPAEPPRS